MSMNDRAHPEQPIACTAASPAYRAHALVLAESFLEHHPEARFALVDLGCFDEHGAERQLLEPPDERIEVLHPAELLGGEEELRRLAMAFSLQGLAGALKPRVLRALLARERGPVVLIDADICVFGSLEPVAELAREHGTVVTPHLITPLLEAEYPTLLAGVFNTGFVAVAEGAEPLLDWWVERTRRESLFRPQRGLVWEQAWLGIAPAFFPLHVLRDAGVNAMTRELHDGDVEWHDGEPRLGGRPLACFHFSGPYDPLEPGYLLATASSGDAVIERRGRLALGELPWLDLARRPGARRMSELYAERLLAAGFEEARATPAPFSALPGPPILHRAIREAFRTALLEVEESGGEQPPNPFAEASADQLLAWLAEPAAADGPPQLSRLLSGLWSSHAGAAAAFPRVPGEDTTAFIAWARRAALPPPAALPPALRAAPESAGKRRGRKGLIGRLRAGR
jgi:hypothetical protein